MSRIGKLPIDIPKGVDVELRESDILVKGPKGEIKVAKHSKVTYKKENEKVLVTRVDESKIARQQHGLRRTLLNNAVLGVSKGFEKGLELVGVGYRANLQGKKLVLNVGYSNSKEFNLPDGIDAKVEGNKIMLAGIDKQLVGETAAQIRRIRPPEPYKGKGIKYINEQIRRKAGKSAKK